MHERLRDAQGRFISPYLLYDLFLCGDIAELRRLAEAGTSALSTLNPEALRSAQFLLAWAEGRWGEAESGYVERAQRWISQGSKTLLVWTDRSLLRIARIKADARTAEAIANRALAMSLASQAVKYEFIYRAELALLQAERGCVDDAEVHLARCREILVAGEDWRGVTGRVLLAEAVNAAAGGRHEQADAQFERALESFRDICLPWDEAETFEVWARACRRFHRSRSRQSFIMDKLDSARAVYERIGAGQPWLDRLDAEARRLSGNGAHAPGTALPDGLTGREAEVLRLVAAGKSSREIGDVLVLSVRTVERHIANIYLKTGAHGRVEAASYAHAHGLVAPGS